MNNVGGAWEVGDPFPGPKSANFISFVFVPLTRRGSRTLLTKPYNNGIEVRS